MSVSFEETIIQNTVEKLVNGKDYREEVVRSINASFLDFAVDFFKKIVNAKCNDESITLDWYKKTFMNTKDYKPDEIAIFAGLNKKTITNIHGTATKEVVINASYENIDYLRNTIMELEKDSSDGLDIKITISYKNVNVNLSLAESLIVINALATKKIQLRGGAWSSIGKKVEKPLLDKLCEMAGVPDSNKDNSHFIKDKKKSFDREVDYKLISSNGNVYNIEVKLMGKGNPESADATIARNSHIFVADTLSEQNCNQLKDRGIEYLVLKDNDSLLKDFKTILKKKNVPYSD